MSQQPRRRSETANKPTKMTALPCRRIPIHCRSRSAARNTCTPNRDTSMSFSFALSLSAVLSAAVPSPAAAFTTGTSVVSTLSFSLGHPTPTLSGQQHSFKSRRRSSNSRISNFRSAAAASNDGDDDFDPLRSPHDYPSGIDAGAVSSSSSAASAQQQQQQQRPPEDLSDTFDPFLMSPNDFPSGIDGAAAKQNPSNQNNGFDLDATFGFDLDATSSSNTKAEKDKEDIDDENWSPLRGAMEVETFADDDAGEVNGNGRRPQKAQLTSQWAVPSATSAAPAQAYLQQQKQQSGSDNGSDDSDDVDLFDVFDPRLSPHAYAKGIPNCSEEEQTDSDHVALTSPAPTGAAGSRSATSTVGVLLIDHGSRRASSNDRLLELASAYQQRSPDHYVVRAAHMEIAAPNIEDGLRELLKLGVSRIVCHPYFLSPGRHVQDDIPQLVAEAMETLDVGPDLPILTTDPIGSSLDLMVGAIGNLVDETLRGLDGEDGGASAAAASAAVMPQKDPYELGGFFKNIQEMIDEQLDD